ncbi:MAG TPA: hypothetical protein VK942_04850, partial [Actinomycetes bacterium]|nr:hypothetical protein [Actinomycetes bacterium]
ESNPWNKVDRPTVPKTLPEVPFPAQAFGVTPANVVQKHYCDAHVAFNIMAALRAYPGSWCSPKWRKLVEFGFHFDPRMGLR